MWAAPWALNAGHRREEQSMQKLEKCQAGAKPQKLCPPPEMFRPVEKSSKHGLEESKHSFRKRINNEARGRLNSAVFLL